MVRYQCAVCVLINGEETSWFTITCNSLRPLQAKLGTATSRSKQDKLRLIKNQEMITNNVFVISFNYILLFFHL